MIFHICGQCYYFLRETHPDDDEQYGECCGMPPQVIVIDNIPHSMNPRVDPANRACAIFRLERR